MYNSPMKILFMSWRDFKNPQAGGAEVFTHEVARHMTLRGHEVTLFCATYPGAKGEEEADGIKIIRRGRQWTVHWHAYRYYKRCLKENGGRGPAFDLVIDEVNTIPFLTPLYVKEEGCGLAALFFQLCKHVWWYESVFPLSLCGYLLEPLDLKVYRKTPVITISKSTEHDLIAHGHDPSNIFICPVGIDFRPLDELSDKDEGPRLIFVGRLNKSKRPDHVIRAFAGINRRLGSATLWIVGEGDAKYRESLQDLVGKLGLEGRVEFLGRVSQEEKHLLMSKARLIMVTSVKEGWGLIVTEAAACGTPAVVYDVDGLRDSVRDGQTGVVCPANRPDSLAVEAMRLLEDGGRYSLLQANALEWSREFSWDRAAEVFMEIAEKHVC